MFHKSILQIQEELHYHKTQQEKLEQQLYSLKSYEEFSSQAFDYVKETIEQIQDPKYLELFKEGLLSLFPIFPNEPIYLEESVETNDYVEKINSYPIPAFILKECAVEEKKATPFVVDEAKSQFKEITPNIIYDPVNKTAYIGMKAKGRASSYGDYLTRVLTIGSKYLITNKPTVVQNAKYEFKIFDIELESIKQLAKFNLNKDYDDKENKEVREIWEFGETTKLRPAPQAYKPAPKLIPLEEIELGEIVYLNSVTNQYKVLNKVELDDKLHLEVICVYNKQMKTLVGQISYLKECYRVPIEDVHMQGVSHPSLKSNELTTEDFTAPPYQKISLDEIEVCDIVSTGEYVKAYYEITEHKGSYLIGKCIHHDSLKMRIGQECQIIDPYLVEKAILPTSVEAETSKIMAAA